jgi:hypothetical protein
LGNITFQQGLGLTSFSLWMWLNNLLPKNFVLRTFWHPSSFTLAVDIWVHPVESNSLIIMSRKLLFELANSKLGLGNESENCGSVMI